MTKPISNPLPTPTFNSGGGKVITRYDEKPLKSRNIAIFPYSTQPKYGSVMLQKLLFASTVKTTYPRLS